MRRVSFEEYLDYAASHGEVEVEGRRISLKPVDVKRLHPDPGELPSTTTTVWSFPKRGSWATHRGDYRGNWPPQMARALILMYSEQGDTVLDPMIGSGTTCIEAKLLGRNCIGVDVNYNAVILSLHRLYWLEEALRNAERLEDPEPINDYRGADDATSIKSALDARVELYHGDARSLSLIEDNSIDLVATHPPYYNIVRYSRGVVRGDLSAARRLEDYLAMLRQVISESFRVLRPGKHMGMLVGDTRIHKHYVPITHYALQALLDAGFILREEVVKIQHRMKTTRELWSRLRRRDFLLIYHEKLFILRKPASLREYSKYRYSSRLTWTR